LNINIFDIFGLVGSFSIAYFYFYAQYKYTFLNSFNFFVGNIVGSLLIVSSLIFSSFNLASFMIETLWICVSIYGIYKYHLIKTQPMKDITLRQNEFSVDGFGTELKLREFKKEDLGFDILFNNPTTNETLAEKSMDMKTFLFNGTCLLTPAAITNSELNVNDIENQWRMNKNAYMIELKEDKDYSKEEIKELFEQEGILKLSKEDNYMDKPYLIIKTGYMDKIEGMCDENGNTSSEIFSISKPGLKIEAAKYISELDLFSMILIDSISFESKESQEKKFHTTHYLMNINEEKKTFTALVYHIKTPKVEKVEDCSVRLGNVPKGIIPGFPVSVKVK